MTERVVPVTRLQRAQLKAVVLREAVQLFRVIDEIGRVGVKADDEGDGSTVSMTDVAMAMGPDDTVRFTVTVGLTAIRYEKEKH